MKKIYTKPFANVNALLLIILSGACFSLFSCKKDESAGAPVVYKVTTTDPVAIAKDSTFTESLPGRMILIHGDNFVNLKAVYFNGVSAYFNPNYTTPKSIIVTIPAKAPTEVDDSNVPNNLRVVTAHGETSFSFKLAVLPPTFISISNENAMPGEKVTVTGTNLYLISKVIFPGNKEVLDAVTSPDGKTIEVTVPSDIGHTAGDLTVVGKYGTGIFKNFNLHQGPGVISNLTADWESGETAVFRWAWWGANRTNSTSLYSGTRGAYLQNNFTNLGANSTDWWNGNRSGNFDAEIPLFTTAMLSQPTSKYALKFEVNTKEPWTAGVQVIKISDYLYQFKPYAQTTVFDTKSKWQTVTIPLTEFTNGTSKPNFLSDLDIPGKDGKISFKYEFVTDANPVVKFDAAFDNFRIVEL